MYRTRKIRHGSPDSGVLGNFLSSLLAQTLEKAKNDVRMPRKPCLVGRRLEPNKETPKSGKRFCRLHRERKRIGSSWAQSSNILAPPGCSDTPRPFPPFPLSPAIFLCLSKCPNLPYRPEVPASNDPATSGKPLSRARSTARRPSRSWWPVGQPCRTSRSAMSWCP